MLKISGNYEWAKVSKESCAGHPELISCCINVFSAFVDRHASSLVSSLVTEMTDNKPVLDKYFTSHAIAICCPDFCRNI